MELNQKLAALRKEKGMSQLELAERLHLSRQAVSRWEVGTSIPSLESLVCLSRLYHIPLDELVRGDSPEAPAPSEPETVSPEPEASPAPEDRRYFPRRSLVLFLLAVIFLIGSVAFIQRWNARQTQDLLGPLMTLDFGGWQIRGFLPPSARDRYPRYVDEEGQGTVIIGRFNPDGTVDASFPEMEGLLRPPDEPGGIQPEAKERTGSSG